MTPGAFLLVVILAGIGLALITPSRTPSIHLPSWTKSEAVSKMTKRAEQIVAAVLGAAATILLLPGQAIVPVSLIGAAAGLAAARMIDKTFAGLRRKRRLRALDFSIIAFLEQIHIKLANGNSLLATIVTSGGIANQDICYLQGLVKSGLDLETAALYWIEEFDTPSKRRLVDLLLAKTTTSETLTLLAVLLQQLKDEQRFTLIADIEKRSQLVWIPVTIAVLVPGMIFIAIPLEATLRTLIG